jgi:hypothetical protein
MRTERVSQLSRFVEFQVPIGTVCAATVVFLVLCLNPHNARNKPKECLSRRN